MKILFYQPYNQIVVYIESVLEQFAKEGHQTFFLSHAEKGETHKNLEKFGCKTFSLPIERKSSIQYYKDRVLKLARFCNDHNIDVVYSHFQEANLISVLAQYFCKSKFVINRHHSDCAFLDNNWKEKWGDKIINRLSTVYIATSPKVWRQIVEVEKVNASKVDLINYGYNFDSFQKVNHQNVEVIKGNFNASYLLVKAARFIPEKRHKELIDAIKELVNSGLDIKLLLLGRGPLEQDIRAYISKQGLEEYIFLLGFRLNVMDYFAAADLVVHFSLSEASNSAMKEAAITDTPVAVCSDVGDFDEYITQGKNGILLDKKNPGKAFVAAIEKVVKGEYNLSKMGKQLHEDVIKRFDIHNVAKKYQELNQLIANELGK